MGDVMLQSRLKRAGVGTFPWCSVTMLQTSKRNVTPPVFEGLQAGNKGRAKLRHKQRPNQPGRGGVWGEVCNIVAIFLANKEWRHCFEEAVWVKAKIVWEAWLKHGAKRENDVMNWVKMWPVCKCISALKKQGQDVTIIRQHKVDVTVTMLQQIWVMTSHETAKQFCFMCYSSLCTSWKGSNML